MSVSGEQRVGKAEEQISEDRGQKTVSQKTEIRGQRAEVRGQKSEFGSRRLEKDEQDMFLKDTKRAKRVLFPLGFSVVYGSNIKKPSQTRSLITHLR